MAYGDKNIGDVILASDYNEMANKVRVVYEDMFGESDPVGLSDKAYFGYGSGQTGGQDDANAPYIRTSRGPTELITSEDWARLIRAILACQFHQGIINHDTNQVMIELVDGIYEEEVNEEIGEGMPINYLNVLNDAVSDITTYAMTVTEEDGYYRIHSAAVDTRVEEWTGIIAHKFKLTFSSIEHARYYFNTGGDIRFSGANEELDEVSGNNVVIPIDEQWRTGLMSMGTVVFNYGCTINMGEDILPPVYPLTDCLLNSSITETEYKTNGAGFYNVVEDGLDEENALKIFEFSIGGAGDGIYADDLVLITAWTDETVDNEYSVWIKVEYISASGGEAVEPVTGKITSNVYVRMMEGITYDPYEGIDEPYESLNVPYVEVVNPPTYTADTVLADPAVPIDPI